jgi:hypothetical protein
MTIDTQLDYIYSPVRIRAGGPSSWQALADRLDIIGPSGAVAMAV